MACIQSKSSKLSSSSSGTDWSSAWKWIGGIAGSLLLLGLLGAIVYTLAKAATTGAAGATAVGRSAPMYKPRPVQPRTQMYRQQPISNTPITNKNLVYRI